MRPAFVDALRCPRCQGRLRLSVFSSDRENVEAGVLLCPCGGAFPVIAGVPRVLPEDLASTLPATYEEFFREHPDLAAKGPATGRIQSLRTLRAFSDEWKRFPELLKEHERIFDWYFEGPAPVRWKGLRVLDAGCGMGRWLHFAAQAGAEIVGMDAGSALDVAQKRESADFVQADLRFPPFPPSSFDLVYSLGVLHHLEDPKPGLRALGALVRPGGELRLYVYRSIEDEAFWKRVLLSFVTLLRRFTTRLPFAALHAFSWIVAVFATMLFLLPSRLLRRSGFGNRLTRSLPLVQYADLPFRMVVAEQFDRFAAPIEGRYRRQEVEAWLREIGFEVKAILPGLGWRAIGRRPCEDQTA